MKSSKLSKYLIFLILLIIWSIVILYIATRLDIGVWLIIVLLGAFYIPFCKWIIAIRLPHSIWIGYLILMVSITLTILLVDMWINYSPDGMTHDIRPVLQPIFRRLTFIRTEYDLNDFNMLLRIMINSLLSICFLMIIDKLKKINKQQQPTAGHTQLPG